MLRKPWLPVLVALACAPVLILGAAKIKSNTGDVDQWLPEGAPERGRYDAFRELFHEDDFLLVTWRGCTLDDDRVDRMAELLEQRLGGDTGFMRSHGRCFHVLAFLRRGRTCDGT